MLETILGPMEGVSDFPFRMWVNLISKPTSSYTPFLRLTESFPHNDLPSEFWPEILIPSFNEQVWWQTHLQVMTPDPAFLARLRKQLPKDADSIDMNCGCPSKMVTGKGSGSSLLKTVEGFKSFVEECVSYFDGPKMSLKMRTGFHDESLFEDLVSCLPAESLKHLTVHGRTREQKYSGYADWSLIDRASREFKGKVFGSGDIVSQSMMEDRLKTAPQISGVFIARGAIQKPWIFSELQGSKSDVSFELALVYLEVFHWLTRLWDDNNPESFLPCLLDASQLNLSPTLDSWLLYCKKLQDLAKSHAVYTDRNTRRSLARTKMIWSYMRMNWSSTSTAPEPLRAATFDEMMMELKKLSTES
ncbi:MAG: tRNA-dihydrouridine synthase family protein [Pseudomonadota bacterium]